MNNVRYMKREDSNRERKKQGRNRDGGTDKR